MSRDYSRRLPAGTKVSAGTPIGRSVTAHFPLVRDFKSAVRGRPGLGVSTGPVLKPTVTGKAAVGNGTGKISTGLLASDLGMTGASARTVIVEFMQLDVSYTGGKGVFSFGDTSGTPRSQFTLLSATSFRRIQLATYSNDYSYDLWTQGGTYARVFLAITYDGNLTIRIRSHCRVFLNDGTPQGVVSRSFSQTLPAPLNTGNTAPLDLMGGGPYNFGSMNVELFNATFIGGRALTEREIDNFYRNPQQIMAAAPSFPYALLDSAPVVVAPIELAGAVVARAASTGALTTSVRLSGTAQAAAAAAGALSTSVRLAGAALASAAGTGALSSAISLAGAVAAQSSASAQLQGSAITLSGGAYVQTSAAGSLATSIRLAGAAAAQSTAAGVLATAPGGTQPPTVEIDATKIPAARTVIFAGRARAVVFQGGIRTVLFAGGTRTVRF
jgi:hypothetical protein